jgi:enoyl-CoA hydratase
VELECLRLEPGGRVVRVTFARPHVLNAMHYATILELERVVDWLGQDAASRVVVITGAGRSFSTGIDLKELAAGESPFEYHEHFERALRGLEMLPKIVIAAINGWCLGGGLQLALACDIRAASAEAQLGLPAIKESLIPGLSTFRLPRYVGMGWAKRLVLGGENLPAEVAQRIGLVDYVFPAETFPAEIERLVEHYLSAASEGARLSKLLLNRGPDLDHAAFLAEYFSLQRQAQSGHDFFEAQRAYLEGRMPVWE